MPILPTRSPRGSHVEMTPLLPTGPSSVASEGRFNLPDHLLPQIFAHLDAVDRLHVGQVSRAWRLQRPDPLPGTPPDALRLYDNFRRTFQDDGRGSLARCVLPLLAGGGALWHEVIRLSAMDAEDDVMNHRRCAYKINWASYYEACLNDYWRPQRVAFSFAGWPLGVATIIGASAGTLIAVNLAIPLIGRVATRINRRLASWTVTDWDKPSPEDIARKARQVTTLHQHTHQAVDDNDGEALTYLHNLRVPLVLPFEGATPLERALESDKPKAVQALIACGVPATSKALELSLIANKAEATRLMLQALPEGAQRMNLALTCSGEPLVAATEKGAMDTLTEVLQAAGTRAPELTNALSPTHGYAPLHAATRDDRLDEFKALLNAGANPDLLSTTAPPVTPRMLAVTQPQIRAALQNHDGDSAV